MRYFKFTLLLVLALCAMGAGPCDEVKDAMDDDATTCAENGEQCNNSLDFDILLADAEAFPAGMYSFEIVPPDGSYYTIDCQLIRADAPMECSGPNLAEMVAGMDLLDYTKMHLHINGAPKSCTLTVYFNEGLILEKNITPTYDTYFPNGEGCTPKCYIADDAVAVVID